MSDALLLTKLVWNGRAGHGQARHAGVTWDIKHFPASVLPGLHVVEIAFYPGTRECELREASGRWRPMTQVEQRLVMVYLKRLSAGTHRRSEGYEVGVNSDFARLGDGDDGPPMLKLLIDHRRESLEWRREQHARSEEMQQRMERFEAALEENTKHTKACAETTQVIADTLIAGRLLRRIMSWVGAIAVGAAAVWSLAQMFFQHGPPGGGAGPAP